MAIMTFALIGPAASGWPETFGAIGPLMLSPAPYRKRWWIRWERASVNHGTLLTRGQNVQDRFLEVHSHAD